MSSRSRLGVLLGAAALVTSFLPCAARAASLDKEGTISLGLRTYTSARIGTEDTDEHLRYATDANGNVILNADGYPQIADRSMTFPRSSAGSLRQNRFFAELELKHRLDWLISKDFGPFTLLKYLPFKVRDLQYGLTYRGEGEGVYDWGPDEYSHAWGPHDFQISNGDNLPVNPIAAGAPGDAICAQIPSDEKCRRQVDVYDVRHALRNRSVQRSRLFSAYIEAGVGSHIWFRFGRQVLSWGETDSFRLLDNINPVDNSFGGFLIPLDERRMPLDMLRAQYRFDGFGPIEEPFLEMYAAVDRSVAYWPGTPQGSPWTLPNLGDPTPLNDRQVVPPGRSFRYTRGGGRIVWNMWDATFSIAHYYTYFDNPRVQMFIHSGFPYVTRPDGYSSLAVLTPARVRVTGATSTFPVPLNMSRTLGLSGQPIVRTEFAYFSGEARYRQSEIDPFVLYRDPEHKTPDADGNIHGPRRSGDSANFVLGLDLNQFIRALNPTQSFFISTQFFYKHLVDAADSHPINVKGNFNVREGEVLPVPSRYVQGYGLNSFLATEPVYVRTPKDQILQTLLISTSYRSSTINPSFLMVYDWTGALVFQPAVTFLYDPFRFTIDYSAIQAGALHGASGISLLRDRDNIQFRIEYVI